MLSSSSSTTPGVLAVAAKLGRVLRVDMPCLADLAVIDGELGSVLAEADPIEMLRGPLGLLLLSIDFFSTHHHTIPPTSPSGPYLSRNTTIHHHRDRTNWDEVRQLRILGRQRA